MDYKTISGTDFKVSALGLGCMAMSEFYGSTNEIEAVKTIHMAVENGITHFDTADNYGYGDNEILVGNALKNIRDKITIATKFGIVRDRNDPTARGINGNPEYVRKVCHESLKRLGVTHIDLLYLHRIDYNVPIEDTIGAMSQLVKEGKVKYLGLSEADPEHIKRAHSIHPITAVQSEYSLWTRGAELEVLPLCRELKIGFIPYSPLGRGFLTGKITSVDNFEADDFRKFMPRFQKENIKHNLKIIDKLNDLAKRKNCTPAQLALAWIMHKGNFIVPIFGTRSPKYLLENIGALKIKLTLEEIKDLESIAHLNFTKGTRYTENVMEIYRLNY